MDRGQVRAVEGIQVRVSFRFEPRDLWVGVFWDRRAADDSCGVRPDGTIWQTAAGMNKLQRIRTTLYICLLPMFVIKVVL